jgi:molybdopterin-guanine dinucleotide biosynthesis protein A
MYVLAGGQSRRFGENKALVTVHGEPLLQRVQRQMRACGLEVVIVAQSCQHYDLGSIVVHDRESDAGPLVGLVSALEHADSLGESLCYVTSCDFLEWQLAWQETLWATRQAHPQSQIALMAHDPFQPFPGLYDVGILDAARDLIASGERSLRALINAIHSGAGVCYFEGLFRPQSFNTREEFEQLLKTIR